MNGGLTPTVAVCFSPATDQRDYFQLCVGELSLNCKAGMLQLMSSFSILFQVSQAPGVKEKTFRETDLERPYHSEAGRAG